MNQALLQIVREVLAEATTEPRLLTAPPEEVSLVSLAIPSVEMIGVVIDLEDRLGRVIDQTQMYELRTVADLVHALDADGG
ncbi:MAG: acyl carrier protein [Polyangiaceae bacterium]|jgi:acyl carrier protein|nr:acyl carrier protein [Polyangiaceae bacterium]